MSEEVSVKELGSELCPGCSKKLVRVFAPNDDMLEPHLKKDVNHYLRRMRKAMSERVEYSKANECFIAGPTNTLRFNASHFAGKPYSDNLGTAKHGECGWSIVLSYDKVDLAARFFLRQKNNRTACIANHIEPSEVKQWFKDNEDLIEMMFDSSMNIKQIEGTDVYIGMYQHKEWNTMVLPPKMVKMGGSAWQAECDPVIAEDIPPVNVNDCVICPSSGSVVYVGRGYKCEMIAELPDNVEFTDLAANGYERLINLRLKDGTECKTVISKGGGITDATSAMSKSYQTVGVPEEFWIIQKKAFVGSTPFEDGDLLL